MKDIRSYLQETLTTNLNQQGVTEDAKEYPDQGASHKLNKGKRFKALQGNSSTKNVLSWNGIAVHSLNFECDKPASQQECKACEEVFVFNSSWETGEDTNIRRIFFTNFGFKTHNQSRMIIWHEKSPYTW